ncbi:MAG TPA: nucleoside hydrolase-like domain-containing protein [Phycisphaerae bacterium]|nr:nucleoside hydrolase-like domain-containing protein [Phycisphaerae bacterium]
MTSVHLQWVVLLIILSAPPPHAASASPLSIPDHAKNRIVVMTDIGGDPDDRQSLVRFLLHACDFKVEGLCTGFGWGHYKDTRPDLIREAIKAYGEAVPNLRRHRSDYPDEAALLRLVKDGHNGDPHKGGPGMDSEASDWIIDVVDRQDKRPVWFSIWGGPRELAQAIWKIQTTRPAEQLAAFKRKIRVHSIADQDKTARWIKQNHPDVFWIFSEDIYQGFYAEGDQTLVSPDWMEQHIRGPLKRVYPPDAHQKVGVKEGDTPSFMYLLPNGLSDPEQPEQGNWGGRFVLSGRGHEYLPAPDLRDGRPDLLYTIHRWRPAYQNAFQARMDWCVLPFDHANHEPVAHCNGDASLRVLRLPVEPGANIALTAAGSSDPDGDRLDFRWWTYHEAGTFPGEPRIEGATRADAVVSIPREAAGRAIHIILEVTDTGRPPLTAYRRVVLEVHGEPRSKPSTPDDNGNPSKNRP